jgi:hypothetical protein
MISDEETMRIRRNAHLLILQIHALEVGEIIEIVFYSLINESGVLLWSEDTSNSEEEDVLIYFCILDIITAT